jgi:hypothetical protein
MREAAQRAQELQRQVEATRSSLNEAAAKVAELEQQAATAQRAIVQYEEQEHAIARALQDAHRTSEELLRSAKTRAEETIAAAKSAGEGIVQAARATATETLHKARESAQEQIQAAEHATATAKTAAAEIVQTARAASAETLERARESAQEQLRAAERKSLEQLGAEERQASEHLARLRAESDKLVEETNRKVQEVRQAADHHLTSVTAKLDVFVRDREEISRGLDSLARSHAESLQMMARLRSEVQGQILPAVHRLLRRLKGEEAGEGDDTAAAPAPSAQPEATVAHPAVQERRPTAEAAVEHRTAVPDAAARDAEPARETAPPERATVHEAATQEQEAASEAAAHEPKESGASAARHIGQIVVSPIHSFLQATKFMTALSQVDGVASVKLRTYSGAKATIEVVTVRHTVAGINFRAISGFSIEVVESTDTHLALKLGSPARVVPG